MFARQSKLLVTLIKLISMMTVTTFTPLIIRAADGAQPEKLEEVYARTVNAQVNIGFCCLIALLNRVGLRDSRWTSLLELLESL